MKKKISVILMAIAATLCLCFGLSACGSKVPSEPEHTHTYATAWTYDETYHWHRATCEHTSEISGKERHSFNGSVCSVCSYDKSVATSYKVTLDIGSDRITEELTYSFTVTETPITYTAKYRTDVIYINGNGETQYYTEARIQYLSAASTYNLSGWYLLSGVSSAEVNLTVSGEANIILADGCDWTVNNLYIAKGNTLYKVNVRNGRGYRAI